MENVNYFFNDIQMSSGYKLISLILDVITLR